jgi:hypothetical protein
MHTLPQLLCHEYERREVTVRAPERTIEANAWTTDLAMAAFTCPRLGAVLVDLHISLLLETWPTAITSAFANSWVTKERTGEKIWRKIQEKGQEELKQKLNRKRTWEMIWRNRRNCDGKEELELEQQREKEGFREKRLKRLKKLRWWRRASACAYKEAMASSADLQT